MEAAAPLDTALAEFQDPALLSRRYVDDLAASARIKQELESKAALRQLCLHRRALERRVEALVKALLSAMPEFGGRGERDPLQPAWPPSTSSSASAARSPRWPQSPSCAKHGVIADALPRADRLWQSSA